MACLTSASTHEPLRAPPSRRATPGPQNGPSGGSFQPSRHTRQGPAAMCHQEGHCCAEAHRPLVPRNHVTQTPVASMYVIRAEGDPPKRVRKRKKRGPSCFNAQNEQGVPTAARSRSQEGSGRHPRHRTPFTLVTTTAWTSHDGGSTGTTSPGCRHHEAPSPAPTRTSPSRKPAALGGTVPAEAEAARCHSSDVRALSSRGGRRVMCSLSGGARSVWHSRPLSLLHPCRVSPLLLIVPPRAETSRHHQTHQDPGVTQFPLDHPLCWGTGQGGGITALGPPSQARPCPTLSQVY